MAKQEIRDLIKQYDHAYYNLDAPLVSDTEYDALKAQLNEDEISVPGNALFNKYHHSSKILSLDKVKITDQDTLRDHITRLWPICIQPKLDGLTLVVYPDGTCVTRGDGEIGENITANCANITGIGVSPGQPVRCEAVILKKDFEKLNQERLDLGLEIFKNARNAAAGMLRQKDSAQVKLVTAIAYEIIGVDYKNDIQILDLSHRYNWHTVSIYIPKSIQEALDYINNYNKESYSCDIDGLVIKHIGIKEFTTTGHHYNGNVAVKFTTPEVWAQLRDIEWTVGRTGRITPTAVFDPIDLMGSVVTKATLHNIAYMNAIFKNKLSAHTDVCVTKANDIIPAIIDSRFQSAYTVDLLAPTECPACGSILEQVNDQLFCRNRYCKEKVIAQAAHLASRQALDINGLSEETIRKMYDALESTNNYTFPLYFNAHHLLKLEGFAEKSANKLYNEIQDKIKNTTISRFLIACGIPLVGKTASKLIAKHFDSLKSLRHDIETGSTQLKTLDGIGNELIKSLAENWWRIEILLNIIEPIQEDQKVVTSDSDHKHKQLTFVITGKFEHPRSYYEELITSRGHLLVNSVTKKTDYLIIEDIESSTTKAKKARQLGITLIDDKGLEEILSA